MNQEGPDTSDVEAMKAELLELRAQSTSLSQENEELRARLDRYEPKTEEPAN